MPLTRSFRETVLARAERDPAFRRGLLTEALDCFLAGEIEEGKSILRDYVNATVGFEELGRLTDKKPKSLMRMLSKEGNPRADNLFAIISELQAREGVTLSVEAN
ncbi:MAG: transcriptional regulator [Pseudomonadota bacterium]